MSVYSLKKMGDTEELHLFEGEMVGLKSCKTGQKSICGKMDKADNSETMFACVEEGEARERCAEAGRRVCGTCVSRLYATYS